jgi:hypothetical protein
VSSVPCGLGVACVFDGDLLFIPVKFHSFPATAGVDERELLTSDARRFTAVDELAM